jgi:hypothetical protein
VRTGLAFTGVAVALIGVGVLLVAFSLSSGPTGSIVEGVNAPHIAADSNYTHVIPTSPQKSANVVYVWSSTKSVEVYLYVAAGCPNNTAGYVCPGGPPVMSWWSTTGAWSWTGSVSEPWLLVVVNPNSTVASYNGTMVESFPATSTYGSGFNLFVLLIGSIVLIAIGALALFLGLFLRGGVYGPKRDPVGQPDSALLRPDADEFDDEVWDDGSPTHDPDDDEP